MEEVKKELLVCPKCGNSKNEIFAGMEGLKIIKIFIRCPNCGKEILVAHMA